MTDLTGKVFWGEMANLLVSRPIVIDRPQGEAHPRFPDLIYPFDHGYVEGTLAADGDGIDVWVGSQEGVVLQESYAHMIQLTATLRSSCCSVAQKMM